MSGINTEVRKPHYPESTWRLSHWYNEKQRAEDSPPLHLEKKTAKGKENQILFTSKTQSHWSISCWPFWFRTQKPALRVQTHTIRKCYDQRLNLWNPNCLRYTKKLSKFVDLIRLYKIINPLNKQQAKKTNRFRKTLNHRTPNKDDFNKQLKRNFTHASINFVIQKKTQSPSTFQVARIKEQKIPTKKNPIKIEPEIFFFVSLLSSFGYYKFLYFFAWKRKSLKRKKIVPFLLWWFVTS